MRLLQRLGITLIKTKLKLLVSINKEWAASYAFKLFCTPLPSSIVKDKGVLANAAPVYVMSGKNTIKGYQINHPQQKKILILHGFSSTALHFEKYVEPFINKGFEVLAFDAPAHGNSTGSNVNAVIYSQMIKDVIEKFGAIEHFVSHSFGGLALSLAMEELNPNTITKLVLIAPAAETTTAVQNAFQMLGINNEKLKKVFYQKIQNVSGKHAEWFSVNRILKDCNASILIVQDEDDTITPLSDLEEIKKENRSNIKWHITKGLGHNKIYRDKEVINKIVNFVAEN